ncbi:ABC transporter ATP-binding protein [Cyclobacteriaceae bacterium]|nr:ABC transporter ATP-binding protein [Cyclobacteriaceae bacterium]MDB4741877.1 ABC transporter ATP-binding protein [Cyclobacteriaceae bacterium]
MTVLNIQGVTKSYTSDRKCVLSNLDFTLEKGEICAFIGESGTGKSTLLKLIAGLETSDSGTIILEGKTVESASKFVAAEDRGIGFVFQDFALFPHMSIKKNVGYGLAKFQDKTARVSEVLRMVGLASYGDRYPHELSGGEQQRIALARALAPNPTLLLLDEPFSNLDTALKSQIRNELFEIIKGTGISCIFVTHDAQDAISLAHKIAVLDQGKVVQMGTPKALFDQPFTPAIARFFGEINIFNQEDFQHFDIELEKADFYGIRPEHITYSLTPEKNSQAAVIMGETFHGLWRKYRIKLSSQMELDLMVDAQVPIEGKEVFITLAPAYLLMFHKKD